MSKTVAWSAAILASLLAGTAVHAGERHYYYTDPQGTVLAKADVAGNVIETSDYRPYGAKALGPAANGLGYTGHVKDADSGLVYMQARYYDPEAGRFISTDPVKKNINRYAYAKNNPLTFLDPTGMDADCSVDCMKMRRLSDSYSLGESYFTSLVVPNLSFGSGADALTKSWSENKQQVVLDMAFKGRYFSRRKYRVELGETGRDDSPMAFDGKRIIIEASTLNGDWSNRQLAGLLGHELYHVSDFENGRFTFSKNVWTYYRRAQSEVNAYKWGREFAGHYDLDNSFFINQFDSMIGAYSPCALQKICDVSLF